MKLYYPGPEAQVRVEMDSGHIAIVTREPRELPEFMHKAAMKMGCLPEGVGTPSSLHEAPAKPDNALLRKLLIKIADAAAPGTVDDEGRPLPDAVNEALGYTVLPRVQYALWAEIEQDIDADEAPEDEPVNIELAQAALVSELAQASFRTLKERLRELQVSDIAAVREVLASEERKEEPRPTVVELLKKSIASLERNQ